MDRAELVQEKTKIEQDLRQLAVRRVELIAEANRKRRAPYQVREAVAEIEAGIAKVKLPRMQRLAEIEVALSAIKSAPRAPRGETVREVLLRIESLLQQLLER